MPKDKQAEEKIKAAAKRVFVSKGFSGCTSREIAKEAGTNVALVNYYFRSKNHVFSSKLSLKDKVSELIEREFEFLGRHPEIPVFVINEMERNKNAGIEPHIILSKLSTTGIFQEAIDAQEKGTMRKVDLVSIIMLIMSNCQHPFMARLLNQQLNGLSDEQYKEQLSRHKEVVKEMLLNYLFPTND